MADACPEAETLAVFIEGGLGPKEQERVESHLAECAYCLDTITFAMRTKSIIPSPDRPT
jgi:hypothetical protein